MARRLRIQRPGGRYHVVTRGNECKAIFRDDTDGFHFLELPGETGRALRDGGSRLRDYAAVSKAVARFGRRLASDAVLREQLAAPQSQLSQ
jgi:hypothetical protein